MNIGGIEVSLSATVEEFNKDMESAAKKIRDFAKENDVSWSKIKRLGTVMGVVGAGIIFTTQKMIEQAAALTGDTSMQDMISDLNSLWDELSLTVAEVALPIFAVFVDVIKELADWFFDLDVGAQKLVIGVTVLGGAFLLFGGTIMGILGTVGGLISGFSAAGLLGTIITLVPVVLGLGFAFLFVKNLLENWDVFTKNPFIGLLVAFVSRGKA